MYSDATGRGGGAVRSGPVPSDDELPSDDERISHLDQLRSTPVVRWPTRERILLEASRLIGTKGYHGASTRDITAAVGIRQPSLFNHFASKTDIVEELLVYDLVIPAERAEMLAAEQGDPAVRLYRYVLWDVRWYHEMPFDLRGLHEGLLSELELRTHKAALNRWRRAIMRIVEDGIEAGVLHEQGTPFLTSVLTALSYEVIRTSHGRSRDARLGEHPDAAASFVLRALLRDPQDLDTVKQLAHTAEVQRTIV